ncbi:hypothetical protein TYRP_013477 [Tyrophagus putrescentiae]|nr:hypothetical protein TYRP_013477 [Tyrophagus putrescentiae]
MRSQKLTFMEMAIFPTSTSSGCSTRINSFGSSSQLYSHSSPMVATASGDTAAGEAEEVDTGEMSPTDDFTGVDSTDREGADGGGVAGGGVAGEVGGADFDLSDLAVSGGGGGLAATGATTGILRRFCFSLIFLIFIGSPRPVGSPMEDLTSFFTITSFPTNSLAFLAAISAGGGAGAGALLFDTSSLVDLAGSSGTFSGATFSATFFTETLFEVAEDLTTTSLGFTSPSLFFGTDDFVFSASLLLTVLALLEGGVPWNGALLHRCFGERLGRLDGHLHAHKGLAADASPSLVLLCFTEDLTASSGCAFVYDLAFFSGDLPLFFAAPLVDLLCRPLFGAPDLTEEEAPRC